MIKGLYGIGLAGILGGCMTLPGSDFPDTGRYALSGLEDSCSGGARILALSVVTVGTGLDTDRIARRNARTGEITYLKDVRWADKVGPLVEQRLALDLECEGFTVLTSHHGRLTHDRLVCEVRALNLVEERGEEKAEVSLSCVDFRAGKAGDVPLVSSHSSTLAQWSASAAVSAVNEAYRETLADLTNSLLDQHSGN